MSEEIFDDEIDSDEEKTNWGDALLDPSRQLSPRHRKLAELLAQGKTNNEIAQELGYTPSRVSILKSNSKIRQLVDETRDRVFEETVGARLKKLARPALDEIERCLLDDTNRYKEQLKVDTAKWVAEKLDGKAAQKIEMSGGVLVGLFDRLDAIKASGASLGHRDVTPQLSSSQTIDIEETPVKAPEELTEREKLLKRWAEEL